MPFLCEDNRNCLAAEDQDKVNRIVSAHNLAQNQKLGLFSGICDPEELEDNLDQDLAYLES